MAGVLKIGVEVTFSDIVRSDHDQRICSIEIKADGSDSVWDIKSKIAVSDCTAARLCGSAHHVRKHAVPCGVLLRLTRIELSFYMFAVILE